MLIPYNVDRPARRFPVVTYSLMGINIFLFLVTVFISNVNLPADRIEGKAAVEAIFEDPATARDTVRKFMDRLTAQGIDVPPEANNDEAIDAFIKELDDDARRSIAAAVAFDQTTGEGYNRYWQIKNSGSTYVMEPHYSALNIFAYRPGDESVIGKLLGLLGSMFLHGDLEHLLGNMLFLWVFGRAIEDALGPRVYLGAYLLCGIAAALLHHFMTVQFAPASIHIPSFGASGAVMGVLGLFAPRFYRTPVRAYFVPIFFIGFAIATGLLYGLTRDVGMSSFIAFFLTGGILYANRHKLEWATRIFPAAWFIGAWIGYKDLYPAIHALAWNQGGEAGDGVAHWAHIGGFFFGMLYALLIGAQNEGKQEFLLEDAEKAFNLGDMAGAVTYSQNVLEREPGNPNAYEVLAKSYMKQNNENDALDNFELAIENYLRIGERGKAASCYLMALEKFPRFILQPATQLAIGNQMAKNYSFKEAAETLVKIPYTFPDATEGEVALLRAAQIYLQYLNQPQTTVQLLQFFLQKYPESQWLPQVERAWKMAHHQLMMPQEEVAPEPEIPAEPVKVRPQAVAPVLELDANNGTPPYSPQAAPPRQPGARTQQMPPRPPSG